MTLANLVAIALYGACKSGATLPGSVGSSLLTPHTIRLEYPGLILTLASVFSIQDYPASHLTKKARIEQIVLLRTCVSTHNAVISYADYRCLNRVLPPSLAS